MASISHKPLAELARAALASALAGEPQPSTDLSELVRRAACDSGDHAVEATHTFFRDVVEPLCDLFDPAATNAYARRLKLYRGELRAGSPRRRSNCCPGIRLSKFWSGIGVFALCAATAVTQSGCASFPA